MKVHIIRRTGEATEQVTHELPGHTRATALEVLLHAQEADHPDLAFRYGCRNERCGLCTVEINGRPRLACRDRVRDGDRIEALSTLPVLRDLVNDRTSVDRRLTGRLPALPPSSAPSSTMTPTWRHLEKCIQCFACLDGCPLHANGAGNPEAFLRIERLRLEAQSSTSEHQRVDIRALQLSRELGIDACQSCRACKCGIGIRLIRDVIDPLLAAVTRLDETDEE